jgi:streptogramin lyase
VVSASRLALLVAGVALIATGCGDDDDGSEATPATTTAESTESGLPEAITAEGAQSVDLADRLVNEITLPAPDWMVSAFDSLWVKLDNGDVVRIDPTSGKEIATIPPGGSASLCQGIGSGDDAIWSCPGEGTIARIDPETNSVADEIRIDKLPDQGRLVSAAGRLWVLTKAGQQLTAVDERTGRPGENIALDGTCTDLASDGTTVWVMCAVDGRVLQVDAEAGELTGELALPDARVGAVGEDLWVGFESGVAQVDPAALEVIAVYDLYPTYGGAIFATDNDVWVREEGNHFLARIDPEEQAITETIEAPQLPSGGDVVVIGDSVWATAADDQALVEVRAKP